MSPEALDKILLVFVATIMPAIATGINVMLNRKDNRHLDRQCHRRMNMMANEIRTVSVNVEKLMKKVFPDDDDDPGPNAPSLRRAA